MTLNASDSAGWPTPGRRLRYRGFADPAVPAGGRWAPNGVNAPWWRTLEACRSPRSRCPPPCGRGTCRGRTSSTSPRRRCARTPCAKTRPRAMRRCRRLSRRLRLRRRPRPRSPAQRSRRRPGGDGAGAASRSRQFPPPWEPQLGSRGSEPQFFVREGGPDTIAVFAIRPALADSRGVRGVVPPGDTAAESLPLPADRRESRWRTSKVAAQAADLGVLAS